MGDLRNLTEILGQCWKEIIGAGVGIVAGTAHGIYNGFKYRECLKHKKGYSKILTGVASGSTVVLTGLLDPRTYSPPRCIFDGTLATIFYILSYNVSSKIINSYLASGDRELIEAQIERARSALESGNTEELEKAWDMFGRHVGKWGDNKYTRKLKRILDEVGLENRIRIELKWILRNLEKGIREIRLFDRLSELEEIFTKTEFSDKSFNELLNLKVKVIEMLLKKERDSYPFVLELLDKTEKLASKRKAEEVLSKILELKEETYKIGIETNVENILTILKKENYNLDGLKAIGLMTFMINEYANELKRLKKAGSYFKKSKIASL